MGGMVMTQFSDFKWLNESSLRMDGNKLIIQAPPVSDFFNNPNSKNEGTISEFAANAPFYYTEVTGDFVMKVQAGHDFLDTYDAASIMVMHDSNVWAKACFEKTDFGTHAAVSVVTNGVSDDANGCNIDGNTVWLQVCSIGRTFAFQYSTDGENFYMMRYFHIPAGETVKVGLVAQAPVGQGGERTFENFSLEQKTVSDIRAGK
jgi:regulation of enolase protein 1 (concanavalin A-like superfamily)